MRVAFSEAGIHRLGCRRWPPASLWLIGPPGIGKTIVSCFLVDKLQELLRDSESPSAIFAYYFCDNKDEQRQKATAILQGILVQILKKAPELFDLVKRYYRIKRGSFPGNLDALWRMLVQILNNSAGPIYVLIDALDECEEASRIELLALLADLDPSTKARILITGRPEADIEETGQTAGGHLLRLDSAKINDDLSRFIDMRVDELGRKKSYPEKLIQDIQKAVRDQAGGTFLWASLVLKDIAATKRAQSARKKLDSMPSDLPGWVVVSRRPMTVIELATAAALGGPESWDGGAVPPADVIDELKDGFRCCRPLLYHGPDDDTINLVHQSAKDYFVAMDSLSPYRVNREETSMKILETCWRYVAMPEFEQGAVIVSRTDTSQLVPTKLSKRVLDAYGFLGYAAEELRDGGQITERLTSITKFVRKSQSLDPSSVLRDHWLAVSVSAGHVEGVQALLDKHADTTARGSGWDWYPALHLAAMKGHAAIVRLLVQSKCDVSHVWNRQTALHMAAKSGRAETSRILLENGAEVNAKGESGQTPLHCASDASCKSRRRLAS
ncbi:hypothetical protein B0T14DRAFT_552877 [Immersiella caudata]|uniref:NACHT domain-containing protein n=1 Tax=Immersiella caudata TaxID=314043 RepID=A0AA39WVL5_9PEZI|nr:hypothetical protein B0T14DRAFT_552877 [Immersiella caudata]